MAHGGATAAEEVVVVTKKTDGSCQAAVQPHGNRYGSSRFALPPNAVAVFHTHSDRVLPQPPNGDRRLADRIGIPILTMSRQGLFVYDPKRRRSSHLMERLDWLRGESQRRLFPAEP